MVKVLDKAKQYPMQIRDVYCNALIDAAEEDERVFVLDCDLVSSIGDASFVKRFPARTINCGIQEANACAFAAGMSSRGSFPFSIPSAYSPHAGSRISSTSPAPMLG